VKPNTVGGAKEADACAVVVAVAAAEVATADAKTSFLVRLASWLKKMSTAFSRKPSMFLSADCDVISDRQMGLKLIL
jgi:hypothetical protein